MKMKKIVALLLAFMMLASILAYAEETTTQASADTNSTELVAYNDFESYEEGYEMGNADGYKYGGSNATVTVDKADVVMFDGGKRIEMSSSNATRTEARISIDNLATTKTIVTGFSIYVDEQIDAAYANIRTNGAVVSTFKITAESNVILGNTTIGVRLDKDTWYDVVQSVNMETGEIKAYIKGGNIDGLYSGTSSVSASSESRYTFIIDKADATDVGMTRVYLDNFFAYSADKALTASSDIKYWDFENFVHSGNAAEPTSGMTVSNSAYTQVSKAYDEEAGNCLAIGLTTASKYPEFRMNISSVGISGESVLEFDHKAPSGSRTYFGIRGNDSTGTSVKDSLRLFQLVANGKIKVSTRKADDSGNENVELADTISYDTWYHYVIKLDTVNREWSMTATAPGKNTISYSGKLGTASTGVYSVKVFELFSYGAPIHEEYLDNITFKSADTAPAFFDDELETANIVKGDKIKFTLNTAFGNAADYRFNVNGVEVTPAIFGNNATITLPGDVEVGDFLFVEACVVDTSGNSAYAVKMFNILADIVISDFAYDTEAATGTVGASANVTSYCNDCTTAVLITAIYDASTNELLALISDDAALTVGTASTLSTNLKLPENNSNVKVVSFIWKGLSTSMAPLCQPLPLQ